MSRRWLRPGFRRCKNANTSLKSTLVSKNYYAEAAAARYRNGTVIFIHTALTLHFLSSPDQTMANIRTVIVHMNDADIMMFLRVMAGKCPRICSVHILQNNGRCHCCLEVTSGTFSLTFADRYSDPEIHWDSLKETLVGYQELRHPKIDIRCQNGRSSDHCKSVSAMRRFGNRIMTEVEERRRYRKAYQRLVANQ